MGGAAVSTSSGVVLINYPVVAEVFGGMFALVVAVSFMGSFLDRAFGSFRKLWT